MTDEEDLYNARILIPRLESKIEMLQMDITRLEKENAQLRKTAGYEELSSLLNEIAILKKNWQQVVDENVALKCQQGIPKHLNLSHFNQLVSDNEVLKRKYELLLQQKQGQETKSVPSEMWRRIRLLCHPDKHQNSDASTKVSQFLNTMKNNA